MDNFQIKAEKAIPEIMFDSTTAKLSICGSSYPENALGFFQPVIEWIENFAKENKKDIEMTIKLDYFNTSSSKALLDILDILNDLYNDGTKASVKWYYEEGNDSILESGEEFAEDLDLPFEIIQEG